jgi:hypothetical protein
MNLKTLHTAHVPSTLLARNACRKPNTGNLGALATVTCLHAQSPWHIASIRRRIGGQAVQPPASYAYSSIVLPLPLAMTGRCNGRRGRTKSSA